MSLRLKLIAALFLMLVVVTSFLLYGYYGKVNLGDRTVTVIIKEGDSFSGVAEKLLDEGVVPSRIMLSFPARFREIDRKLTPGRYDFTGRNSCQSVLDRLEHADYLRIRVTIYEGAPIWKVASILAQQMETDSAAVMALNDDSAFLASLNLPYLEGYLFPQTYFFPWGTPLRDMVGDMVAMFHSQIDTVWSSKVPNDLSIEEVVILASIVEAEAFIDDEKPAIASVYHNRIRKGMKLDADPTVIYGMGGLDRPLNKRDLRTTTPFNTYQRRGLPPTPINSPGMAAIRAALNPDTSDYLFFVADGTGRHRFSRTNAEHNRARFEIKRKMRQTQGK